MSGENRCMHVGEDSAIRVSIPTQTAEVKAKVEDYIGPQGPAGPQGERGPQCIAGPQGPQGPVGARGEKGDPFRYSDFTSAQLEALRGPTGATGPQGPQGPKGDTGARGPQGQQGPAGEAGKTPTVGVDYFTSADKAEMVSAVLAALRSEKWTFTLEDGSEIVKEVLSK